jgi:hypothetical protein
VGRAVTGRDRKALRERGCAIRRGR